ncbi:MAG: hypothetical protein WEE67_06030 [Chloroflexota bacterium]
MRGRHRLWILACVLVLIGLPDPTLAAPRPKPGTAGPILVEWRRDVWLPPEIRTVSETGGSQSLIANDLLRGGRARWSPDGARISGYHKAHGGDGQWDRALMSITADGTGEQVVLTAAEFDAYNVGRGLKSAAATGFGLPFGAATYSPDGTELVFAGVVRHEGPTAGDLDDRYRQRIFAVRLDGIRTIRPLTDGDGDFDDFDPHWSPGANRIVFVRTAVSQCAACEGMAHPVGQQQLWVVSPDASDAYALTSFVPGQLPSGSGEQLAAPAWNGSGTQIAIVGGLADDDFYSGDLWLVNLAPDAFGRPMPTSITALSGPASTSEMHPAWSPNGDRLLFGRMSAANSRNRLFELVVHSAATGSESVIASSTKQAILYPDWRP